MGCKRAPARWLGSVEDVAGGKPQVVELEQDAVGGSLYGELQGLQGLKIFSPLSRPCAVPYHSVNPRPDPDRDLTPALVRTALESLDHVSLSFGDKSIQHAGLGQFGQRAPRLLRKIQHSKRIDEHHPELCSGA